MEFLKPASSILNLLLLWNVDVMVINWAVLVLQDILRPGRISVDETIVVRFDDDFEFVEMLDCRGPVCFRRNPNHPFA